MGYFTGKIVLITGGGGGLGRALALRISIRGARIYIMDINRDGGEETVRMIREAGGVARFMMGDACRIEDFKSVLDRLASLENRIDILINNAGMSITGEIRDLNIEHWKKVIDLNLMGAVNGISAVYPEMVRRGSGQVVNIGSMVGLAPIPLIAPYMTSKYALTGLTRSLRYEGKGLGIRVNLVCPGRLETALLDSSEVLGADRELFFKEIPFRAYPVIKAAERIIRGMIRNESMILFPAYVKWLWWAERFVPYLVVPFYRYSIKKFREIRIADAV